MSPPAAPAASAGPEGPRDGRRPDRLLALADRCVQCGLCLPSCPTYGRSALESESPRGRIALAKAWALETIPPSPAGETHLDQCLGCRRCEAVCPAGVEYGQLLVLARQRQRDRRPPGWRERGLLALVARPAWLRRLLRTYRRLYRVLPAPLRLLPRPPRTVDSSVPVPAAGQAGTESVALFSGCVAGVYEAPLRHAVTRLCAAMDVRVVPVPDQTCCGSLHAHAGEVPGSRALQAENRAAFDGVSTVLSLATGCHEGLAQALATPAAQRVHDASAWIAARADRLQFQPMPLRVALHLPCTQRNVVGSVDDLRRLLRRVPQLEVVELDAGLGCCGAAGMQMLRDPAAAAQYRAPLVEQFARSGAQVLLSANIGCRLHLARACAAPVLHPLEWLATALADHPPH